MDAWDYYKKSVGSIRGQWNTNRKGISDSLSQRGLGPSDDLWITQMATLDSRMESELDLIQNSTVAKRLHELSESIDDSGIVGNEALSVQLGRQAFPWELKLEGV